MPLIAATPAAEMAFTSRVPLVAASSPVVDGSMPAEPPRPPPPPIDCATIAGASLPLVVTLPWLLTMTVSPCPAWPPVMPTVIVPDSL